MLSQIRPIVLSGLKRTERLISRCQSSNSCEKWDVLTAVSLERIPVISRDLNEVEEKFQTNLSAIEKEQSHKSDFELRMEEDLRRQKLLKEGKLELDVDAPEVIQTAQDFLDAAVEEKKSFKLAPRKTKEENERKSLNRALDRSLLFLLEEEVGGKKTWVLPQTAHQPDETLRQTAERVITDKLGPSVNCRFYGNAPAGFYKYRYPKAVREDTVGAKIFFYKAQYLGGEIKPPKEPSNYCWATRTELDVLPVDYRKSVQMFLIDEEE